MTASLALPQSVDDLRKIFGGQLLRPEDRGYDDARKVHNGLIDKRPAVIARCFGTADIVDAVNLGRSLGLEIAVRGGGHNVGGFATTDKGLMIDLSPMKGIYVDAKARKARAQGVSLGRNSIAKPSSMASPQPAASSPPRVLPG